MVHEPKYTIKAAARRTGLSPHVIRAWERRYGAITPSRTGTNRRLYTQAEVDRLALLREVTRAGHSISQIAGMPEDRLRLLLPHDLPAAESAPRPMRLSGHVPAIPAPPPGTIEPTTCLGECLQAVAEYDADQLEVQLARAAVHLSQPVFLDQVLTPLLHSIGDYWQEGSLRVAQEHLASTVIRTFLGSYSRSYDRQGEQMDATHGKLPTMVVTTPVGQWHEFGALMAAATAAGAGWHVLYLGPSLPAVEIAAAANRNQVQAVLFSLVQETDDARLHDELQRLANLLPGTTLLAGGRACGHFGATLQAIGAVVHQDLPALRRYLSSRADRAGSPGRSEAGREESVGTGSGRTSTRRHKADRSGEVREASSQPPQPESEQEQAPQSRRRQRSAR